MNKSKKMITLSIIMMAIGAMGTILFYIYSRKQDESKELEATEQRHEISNNVTSYKEELAKEIIKGDSSIKEEIKSSKQEVLEKNKQFSYNAFKESKRSTEQIISKIDESSKAQDMKQQQILDKLEKIDNNAKDSKGLYKGDIKWGTVINFKESDDKKTFTIEQINFDNPIRNINDVWSPFEYNEYLIKITDVHSLVTIMPPGAKGVKGIILKSDIK